jgi:hypothetical protein
MPITKKRGTRAATKKTSIKRGKTTTKARRKK